MKLTKKQCELRADWDKLLKKYPGKPKKKVNSTYKGIQLPLGMQETAHRTTVEEFNERIKPIVDGQSLTPERKAYHNPKDHCVMPMHKGGYQVVTDPNLIPIMGKKP